MTAVRAGDLCADHMGKTVRVRGHKGAIEMISRYTKRETCLEIAEDGGEWRVRLKNRETVEVVL